jgi:hypothetical protein
MSRAIIIIVTVIVMIIIGYNICSALTNMLESTANVYNQVNF